MQSKDLEKVIDARIRPLLDKAMHQYLGMTVSEIESELSDKLKKTPFFDFEILTSVSFKKAKKMFVKQYLTRLARMHCGNVAEIAAIAGIDRRSVHRLVNELRVNVHECRSDGQFEYVKKSAVEGIIKEVITPYKSSINPSKFKAWYKQAPSLSADIVKELPDSDLNLKDAEREFEKRYLAQALEENNGNISATARKIGLRFETLHRKLKKQRL